MKNNPVGWFEIYVDNMDRAQKFYESVFGCTLSRLESPSPNMVLLAFPMEQANYGCAGALVRMQGYPAGNSSTIVYFSCEDCAVEESRATTAGGKVQRTKMSIGAYGFISLVVDTEGNIIGLHSMQ
jgi:predicted enzyme related to lactoylglutathione lyase